MTFGNLTPEYPAGSGILPAPDQGCKPEANAASEPPNPSTSTSRNSNLSGRPRYGASQRHGSPRLPLPLEI